MPEHEQTRHSARTAATTYSEMARWLVEQESGADCDTRRQLAAAREACQKLLRRLSRLVTPDGSQALLSRALHLAQADFPFLEGVRAGAAPDACFENLDECRQHVETGEAVKGLLTVLATVIDLLVRLIGEDLTQRLVGEIWPDWPLRQPIRLGTSDDGQAAAS